VLVFVHRDHAGGSIDGHEVAVAKTLCGGTRGEYRRYSVVAGDHGRVGEDTAAVGHDGGGLDEQHRPCRGCDRADENVSGT